MTDPALAERLAGLSPKKRELLLRRLGKGAAAEPAADRIPRQPRDADGGGRFPVSASQLREWILDRLQPGTGAYNVPGAGRVAGPVRLDALAASLRELVRRHESLRTTFAEGPDGEPVQVVAPDYALDGAAAAPLVDLSALPTPPADVRRREWNRLLREELAAPFDLARGPLLRVLLLRLGERDHVLLFTMHHIISDGWSLSVFFRELSVLYHAFAAGLPSPLPELPVQYADFAAWQRERLAGEEMTRQIEYWRRQLAGAAPLELPTDRPRPPVQRFEAARLFVGFDPAVTAALRAFGQRQSASLFMVMLAAFAALLSRDSGQDDLTVGTYAGNRNRAELEGLIGFFINSLVLRLRPSGEASFQDLTAQAREVTLEAFAHQDVPFERLLDALKVERDLSRTPLFQVLLVLHNFPKGEVGASETTLEAIPVEHDHADFDLSLWLIEGPDAIGGTFIYSPHLFDASTVERMGTQLLSFLAAAVAEPERPLADLPLLAAAERRQLVEEWSAGPPFAPVAAGVDELVAAQALRAPDAPALEWEGGALTYGELTARASALAGHLRDLGVGPEVLVGLAAERSPEAITALLAVQQAGGAYLPLDPAWPQARLALMIEDAAVPLLLTQRHLAERLPAGDARAVLLDEVEDAATGPSSPADSAHPAYVIYTSGSTGRPKGVLVTRGSLAAYTANAVAAFGIQPGDRVLQFASLSFDTSGEEIWPALASGATLVLRPEDMASSIPRFLAELARLRITVLDLPTAFWHELVLGLPPEGGLPPPLRLVILGGEKALPERLAQWRAKVGPGVRLLNTYGPTEATIVATRRDLTDGPAAAPIGRPIPGARAYVIDRWGSPAPAGVPGELRIGGLGLARGYLGRPDVTAERFVPDPFGPPGARLYRTGDLVRWKSSGDEADLEFLGRIDHQVKIRGFRVELGEIESALRTHPAVRAAAVELRPGPGGDPRLVAYFVRQEDRGEAAVPELRAHLQARVPEYMVPALFVDLPALPLTPSGKVDRRGALPEPAVGRPELAAGYVAPQSQLERAIAAVWRELLGVDRIGMDDNFFDLGAHSLLLVRAHSRLREALGRELTVVDLFRHPSVGALARHLSREEEKPSFQQVQTLAQQQRQQQTSAAQRQREAMERMRKPPRK